MNSIMDRIEAILASEHLGNGEVGRRVRILRMAARQGRFSHYFGVIAGALLQRRQLELRYHGRGRDTVTQRIVSPQRLVHYRDNWYSDALRTFSLERVQVAIATDRPAQDIPDAELDAELGSAYGIFGDCAADGAAGSRPCPSESTNRSTMASDPPWSDC